MNKFFTSLIFLICFSFHSFAQEYKTHKVKQGETIEQIAKNYLVTPYDIYALNPDAKKGLKTNAVIIIPKSRIQSKVTLVKELKSFKTHKVKRKETLYSLSKKYDVEQDEIKKHNPFLYSENLRKGVKLQIPIYDVREVVETVSATKSYKVQPKEGKWRVAYKFGITVDKLEALNPDMNDVLKEGEIIQVPNIDSESEKSVDETYSYYTVLPKEGFYRLKLKLGVEQDVLETLNPELKENGLKAGMVLKIPLSSSSSQNEELDSENLSIKIKDYSTKHIAIMLPFRLNRVVIDSVSDTKKQIVRDPYLSSSLDFHTGALMAIDSLKKMGISLKVDVYDTKDQVSEVSSIINRNNFESVDAVIGPLLSDNFEKAALLLKDINVPIVSPRSKNIHLYSNVFQSRPSDELLKTIAINFVKNDNEAKHIVIVADNKHTAISNELKREFNYASQVFSRKNKEGKEANFLLVDDIKNRLRSGKNIVFLETKNEGFVSNVTSILNSLITDEIQIVLVTTNMNRAFEDDEVSNDNLSNLHFHYGSVSRDYDVDKKIAFLKNFKRIYGEEPNKMSVRGFDVTMDVVLRLATSENLYKSVQEPSVTSYVENKFAYKKKMFGGYYNASAFLVKYSDLKIVEVKQ